jgi:hypothetical protein
MGTAEEIPSIDHEITDGADFLQLISSLQDFDYVSTILRNGAVVQTEGSFSDGEKPFTTMWPSLLFQFLYLV